MNNEELKGAAKILVAIFAVATGWVLLDEGRKNLERAKSINNY